MIKTSCSNKNGGCTHLCLLRPDNNHTCACPTGIKLGKDKKSCADGPTNFLILAHRNVIRQISLDVPYTADVVLPLMQLKLVTSVDVDRKTGEIYWTDKGQDVIQKSTANGKKTTIIIMDELQTPDGIAVDSTGRKVSLLFVLPGHKILLKFFHAYIAQFKPKHFLDGIMVNFVRFTK